MKWADHINVTLLCYCHSVIHYSHIQFKFYTWMYHRNIQVVLEFSFSPMTFDRVIMIEL